MKIRELLEDVSTGGTASGSIATVSAPIGSVISRSEPTVKKIKRKYANAVRTVKYD